MFKTLRSRLLLSYIAVIIAVLLVIAAALFLIATRPNVRFLPTLQRLSAVSQGHRRELARLREAGTGLAGDQETLKQLADDGGVRVLLVNANSNKIVFDSYGSWTGETAVPLEPLPSRQFPDADPNAVFGRFRALDGYWLAYSPSSAIVANNRIQLFYVQREPTALSFFSELFFRPLVGAGTVAFLLAILLAFLIAGWVARPLQKMAVAAEAIAERDYDQQLPPQGPEEVRRVAGSFNSMAAQVKQSRQAQQDFVANVSHDLKTPITSIKGWSQALLDGTASSPNQQRQAAQIIHKEADRMSRMVAQLLDLARIESGQLELARVPVDLSQVMGDVQRNLVLRAQERQIHLTLDTAPVAPVLGDHDRLVQLFTNLADNALTHTSSGGRVHLQVRPHGEKAVEGVVQDTGKGIAPEELSRIFERFYQADKSRAGDKRGSGLGLAIVQELAAAHNGRVLVRSKVGEGSVFIVRLSITDKPEASTILQRN
ncbi:MAG: HAMP domain-containing protein [Chloroflexi bacterium]|nr:HAMP domain-containing protein [Chloroflexota bacterium]